jgi:hypothetical protein
MIIKNLFDIDPAQWGTDVSTYFITGQGYWARVANVGFQFFIDASIAGEIEIKYRVRTGSELNPTDFIAAYKVEVNGIVIPMILDTTKPNDKRLDLFGKSHIGWIKGKAKVIEGENTFNFTITRQYGGLENMVEIVPPPEITQAQLDTMKAGYDAITQDEVTKAREAEASIWKAKIQLLSPVVTALEGANAVIKQVIG